MNIEFNLLEWFIVLLFSFILHEVGHYYFWQSAGFNPVLKFKRGILSITDLRGRTPHPYIKLRILLGGVLIGAIPILFKPSWPVFILYLVGCSIDFMNVIKTMSDLVKEINSAG